MLLHSDVFFIGSDMQIFRSNTSVTDVTRTSDAFTVKILLYLNLINIEGFISILTMNVEEKPTTD